ncbi:uncharacterized protein (DUF58 family) [Catenulispora sp. GAS73]|uniref:DUF58 domain-containing protein n=1 Tax=Catenulispora sp. GAS73 TaxID=3156269 RepID=UPI0035136A53
MSDAADGATNGANATDTAETPDDTPDLPDAPPPPESDRTLRLTSTGTALGLSSLAGVVLAYAFGYPAFAALGTAGLVILLCVIPLTARDAPVELHREVYPLRVARGETAVGLLTVRNQSPTWGQRLSARERVGSREIPVRIGQLPPHAAVEVRYELPTARRGVIDVGPLHWDRTDPLGLVRRRSALPGKAVLHVHPAVHRFPLGTAAQNAQGEQARTDLALEGSITFHTLREYVPGDDLRRIHWRASAHRGELMVRQNIDVTPPKATIVLITDAALYANPDDFEHAVDVAASAAIGAVRAGQAVSLWTTGGLRLSANGSPEESMLFLDRLAGVTLLSPKSTRPAKAAKSTGRTGEGLADTLEHLEHAERGGVLIVVGGHPQPGEIGTLTRIAGRFGLAALTRISTPESQGPGSGSISGSGSGTARSAAGLSIIDAPTAAEICDRWERLAQAAARGVVR